MVSQWHGVEELDTLFKAPNQGPGLEQALVAKDAEGQTPLHYAAKLQKFHMEQMFFDRLLL